jgi:hypothetical protein
MEKAPSLRYDYFDLLGVADPLASDHGFPSELIFLHTFS